MCLARLYLITGIHYTIILLGDTMMIVHNTRYKWYRRGLRSLLVVFLMLSVALCIAHAHAQPITPPAVITAPGTYVLTGDVTGIYEGYGIKIEASDVVLDGQGFNLHGSNRNDIGILVNKYGTALSNVEIKNIKLGDWGTAIRYNYVKSDETDTSSVSNTQIYNAKVGVHVEYSNNVVLSDLSITDTNSGIVVNHESSDVTIDNATITKCGIGVTLEHARGVTISNSNVNTCEVYGIQAGDVQDLSISKTTISDNKYAAITLANVNGFTLHSNVIARTDIGAALQLSSGVRNGLIYDNLFQSRENVVKPSTANAVWYVEKQPGTNIIDGPYLGGNYWGGAEGQSGFSDITPDSEGYGIADMPYEIDAYSIDKYPLHKTDKRSLPLEILQLYASEENEETSLASDSTSPLSITSMPLDGEEIIDISNVAVTNLFHSRPTQTQAPLSTETRGLSSSALLSVEGMSFLVFVGAPDGATVWLIGDAGAEQAGVVSGSVLTVPVDPAGPFYNSYRITAPGYATFEERFRTYPSTSGMSIVLTVTMEPDQRKGVYSDESALVEVSTELDAQNFSEDTFSEVSSVPTPFPTPVSSQLLSTNEVSLIPSPTPFEMVLPEDALPVEEIAEEVLVITTPTPTGTGYLTFSANVDGATITLIDSYGKEHIVGTITEGSHIVPIEIGADSYRAYRIEKDGYGAVSGFFRDYPESDGENYEITVVLNEVLFNIIAAAGPNGQVTPSEATVKPGEDLTIRITPDPGYRIEVVQVNGEIIEEPGFEYTFINIQSDHVLVASFN